MLGFWLTLCVIIGNYLTPLIPHFLHNENIAYLIGTLTKTVIATHVLLNNPWFLCDTFPKGI